jgi:hypothetical protein
MRQKSKKPWALRRDLLTGNYSSTERYLSFLKKIETDSIPRRSLLCLREALLTSEKNIRKSKHLFKTVEAFIRSNGDTMTWGDRESIISKSEHLDNSNKGLNK